MPKKEKEIKEKTVKSKSFFDVFEAVSSKINANLGLISDYKTELTNLNNNLFSDTNKERKIKLEGEIAECELLNQDYEQTLYMLANDAVNTGLDEIIELIVKLTKFVEWQSRYIDKKQTLSHSKRFNMDSAYLSKELLLETEAKKNDDKTKSKNETSEEYEEEEDDDVTVLSLNDAGDAEIKKVRLLNSAVEQ